MRVDDVFAKIWMNLVWLSVHMIVGVQIMKLAVFTMHLFLEYGVGKPSQIWIMNLQRHRAFFDFDVHFAWIAIKVGCSSHDLVVFLHTEFLTVALWSPVSEVTTASPPSGTKFFCLYYFDEHSLSPLLNHPLGITSHHTFAPHPHTLFLTRLKTHLFAESLLWQLLCCCIFIVFLTPQSFGCGAP